MKTGPPVIVTVPVSLAAALIAFIFAQVTLAVAQEPIRVGVISSLDPIGAPWSESANLGLRLAAHELNADGGVNGSRLELLFEDDRFDPKRAVAAYQKLHDVEKIKIFVGPQFEQTLSPVAPLAQRDGSLLITTIASTPLNHEKFSNIIHSVPSDKLAARCLANAIVRDKRRRLALLMPEEAYSQTFANWVEEALPDIERLRINYLPQSEDLRPVLLKAKHFKPDALIFFFVTAEGAAQAFKKQQEIGLTVPVYSNEVLHESKVLLKEAGELARGTVYCGIPFDPKSPKIAGLLARLPEKPALPLYALVAYDTLHWLAERLKEGGSQLKQRIYSRRYSGILTDYAFDPFGDLIFKDFAEYQVQPSGFSLR